MKKALKACAAMLLLSIAATNTQAQWNLTGNSNATNSSYVGTTNGIPLQLGTKNSTRLTIDSNGKIGIATAPGVSLLTMKGAGSTPAASWISNGAPLFAGFGEATPGNADFNLMMAATVANARGVVGMKRARGTLSAPTVVFPNDQLGSLLVSGFDGSAFQGAAAVDFFVDGTPTAGNLPARISFVTGTNGSNRTERLKIGNTGDITINTNQLFVQKATGNVGIGTILPQAKMDVRGEALINDLTAGRGGGSDTSNTAFGRKALFLNVPNNSSYQGIENTAFGFSALAANTQGTDNTAIGYNSLSSNKTGIENTAVGVLSLKSNTVGYYNTAVGVATLAGNTAGYRNTAIGEISLSNNTTGNGNTGIGSDALAANTTGSSNTGVGRDALTANTTGDFNTAIGHQALTLNKTGSRNTALGYSSMPNCTNANFCVGVGYASLYYNQTGNDNIGIGRFSLYYVDSSGNNVAVGYGAGDNTYKPRQCTFLGNYATGSTDQLNATAIGANTVVTASNSVRVGSSFVTSIGGQVGWTTISDGRFKQNIQTDVPGLSFINKLRPVTYNLNVDGIDQFYVKNNPVRDGRQRPLPTTEEVVAKQAKSAIRYTGFLAQEVAAAAKEMKYDFSGVDAPKNDKDYYGLRYAEFVVPLVKAVQELSANNEELKKENATTKANLQKQIDDLKAMLQQLLNTKSTAPCPPMAGK